MGYLQINFLHRILKNSLVNLYYFKSVNFNYYTLELSRIFEFSLKITIL